MNIIEGHKIVLATEMQRIERLSIEKGASDETYMVQAGEKIAAWLETFIQENTLSKEVTLLVGKGNNGGDAFVAGTVLIHRGYQVRAYHLFLSEECSPLSQKYEKAFIQAGGDIYRGDNISFRGVILDGLLGTGFKGKLEGKILEIVCKANRSKHPIVAIDIPSGVNGDTGMVDPIAIQAEETVFLGLPKLGCFLNEGYNFVGNLHHIDFGMDVEFLHKTKVSAFLLNKKNISHFLPPLKRIRHKYEVGYIIAIAGSPGMGGAAVLSSLSALRAGAGIVRLFYPEGMQEELSSAPYELVQSTYCWDDLSQIFEELKRASAALIGPGLGRFKEVETFINQVISKLEIPCVIDADGLFHVKKFPKGAILTPHHKEMSDLLKGKPVSQETCQNFSDQNQVTIVLKGAPTWIYHPKNQPLIINTGDPGMATAGTGDVLTGIIGALLAQKLKGREAAALGVYLHGVAGEYAAEQKTSFSMIASDLIEALPLAFKKINGRSA